MIHALLRWFCIEKELLHELQRCRRTTKPPTPSASGGTTSKRLSLPARLEIHLRNIEDERDMYKNEVEILQKLLNNPPRCTSSSSPSSLRGRSLSPSVATRGSGRRDTATSPVMHLVKRSASTISTSPTRCTVCGINRNRLSPSKVREQRERIPFDFIAFLGCEFVWNSTEKRWRRTRSFPTRVT